MKTLKDMAESLPVKKTFSLWDEFRQFAFKGNVVDLALGVVIGGAFAGIVNSLVKNIIMPLVAIVVPGDQSYTGWTLTINGKDVPYGAFLGEVVNFLLLALLLFLFVVKFLGWVVRAKKAETLPPSRQEELLAEIRDLLLLQSQGKPPPNPPAAPPPAAT